MISSASSQQRLTDSTVIVPIKSLKNALLVKVERDNLKKELTDIDKNKKYCHAVRGYWFAKNIY